MTREGAVRAVIQHFIYIKKNKGKYLHDLCLILDIRIYKIMCLCFLYQSEGKFNEVLKMRKIMKKKRKNMRAVGGLIEGRLRAV
jgi:hypothetical protein